MAKFRDVVGFAESSETEPGVYTEVIQERVHSGDVITNKMYLQQGPMTNDNININNRISIVADPYAFENFHSIRYVKWMGTLWKVTSVEVQRPRLILSIGGVYNASN